MLEMATLVERVGNIRLVDTQQLILRIMDDPPLQNAGALHMCWSGVRVSKAGLDAQFTMGVGPQAREIFHVHIVPFEEGH